MGFMKIITHRAKLVTLFAGLFMLLLLTGCANMATTIELDGEKFSGSRVMSVTFDVDELNTKLPGGLEDLNGLIDGAIPKQLTYQYEVKDSDAVYNFTLAFESKQDYIDKLKNLLSNKAPDITAPVEDRPIGGLGIFLVRKTMDDVSYEYRNGKNILRIKKKM